MKTCEKAKRAPRRRTIPMKKWVRNTKLKKSPRKSPAYLKAASKRYTGTGTRATTNHRRLRRRIPAKSLLDAEEESSAKAYSKLVEMDFVTKMCKCPACGKAVTGPIVAGEGAQRQEGQVFYRCQDKRCGKRFSYLKGSLFEGMRLTPPRMLAALRYYCKSNPLKSVSDADLVQNARICKNFASDFLGRLRRLESRAGRAQSEHIILTGNVECDAHGMRNFVVKDSNQALKSVIADARRRNKGMPQKYWRVWARVLGACGRDGLMVLKELPPKATTLGAKPPPESGDEIQGCDILRHVQQPVCVFTDGALAWPPQIKAKNRPHRSVTHQHFEFTKEVKKAGRGLSSVAGTQSIDRRWEGLDVFIPNSINARARVDGRASDSFTNPILMEYAYQWSWRHNMGEERRLDMKKELATLMMKERAE